MKQYIVPVFVVVLVLLIWKRTNLKEGYSALQNLIPGLVRGGPMQYMILGDQYQSTGSYGVTGESASSDWVDKPIFSAHMDQPFTNNLRYWRNPDNGTCTPADFCGMYKDQAAPTNHVVPAPPVPPGSGVRVGYNRANYDDRVLM